MDQQQPPGQPPTAPWEAPVEQAGPAPGVRFAGHGGRLLAYIIDTIILTALFMGLTVIGLVFLGAGIDAAGNVTGGGAGAFFLLMLLGVVVALVYFPFFWARSGATPGMRVFRLRVVRDRDGGPISGGQAIMRLVGYWINSIVLYIGFAWILVDQRRRGWHDLIAGTVVIEEPGR
jgi:uncharacterized RDD family membrane protein YckC